MLSMFNNHPLPSQFGLCKSGVKTWVMEGCGGPNLSNLPKPSNQGSAYMGAGVI